MNRVGAQKLLLSKLVEAVKGAVLASDAFFPFGDTVETAVKHGIATIIQPGGSIRDEESIKGTPTKRALLWYLQAFVTLNINLFSLIEGYSRSTSSVIIDV